MGGIMKKRGRILPGMAAGNIKRNRRAYYPYIFVSIFAVFTYFVFDLIRKLDVLYSLPRGIYVVTTIQVGFYLLGVIMVPLLCYANRFLIRQRKRELGLYCVLGMEKKHIAALMLWENVFLYGIVAGVSVALGLSLCRLLFLIVLNLTGMPVNVDFSVNLDSIPDTLLFYGAVTLLNLSVDLVQVGRARPVELMEEEKRGEKPKRLLPLWTAAGVLALGGGYYLALRTHFDNMIFTNFFVEVFLVILGTYFLFTSGSIALLNAIKKRKRLYYRPDCFITVSGMLFRMKRSAASLSNICIFLTMVIITGVCTMAVSLGMDSILDHVCEKNVEIVFLGEAPGDREELGKRAEELAEENGVMLEEYVDYASVTVDALRLGNVFSNRAQAEEQNWKEARNAEVLLMTIEEYDRLEGERETLQPGEVLLCSDGMAQGWENVTLGSRSFRVKREPDACRAREKAGSNNADPYSYVIVAADKGELKEMAACLGVEADGNYLYYCGLEPKGEPEAIDAFLAALSGEVSGRTGFASFLDHRGRVADLKSSYGSLLFVGMFFGLIFLMCLLAILYYKQISEGVEDRVNFEIMQKVGMSDAEIRRTIRSQMRLVFLLPLGAALIHTLVAARALCVLLGAIYFYETGILYASALVVASFFAAVYVVCYQQTSRVYYRIVRRGDGETAGRP